MRILFVSSNSAWHYLDVEREMRSLLRFADEGGHFLKLLPAATKTAITRELSASDGDQEFYDVLHFAGHGTDEGILIKSDEEENDDYESEHVERLTPAQLAELVRTGRKDAGLLLVVLNACKTQTLVEGITGLVDEIVGTTKEVEDRSAKRFTRDFYAKLGEDETVEDAFRTAAMPHGPYMRVAKEGSIKLPPGKTPGEGQVEGLGDFYETFYGNFIDEQIGKLERDHRLNNTVFAGLIAIAIGLWIYLFHDAYGDSDGVFWSNLKTALGNAFYPSTRPDEPDLFSLDGLWNRVEELEAFAVTVIAFFQRTVFFQTRPKLAGLRRLREAIRNWDDLAEEDQEMVRSAVHAGFKESLQS